jgi:phosphoglucomutase
MVEHMEEAIRKRYTAWLNGNLDEETKQQIRKLEKENPNELADAFYRNLEFGTGGLRGVMGVGTNRMNKYTIGMATQGYANYLKQTYPGGVVRVAIAHDSRNNSRQFAEIVANVMGRKRNQGVPFRSITTNSRVVFYHPSSRMPGRGSDHSFAQS